MTNEELAIHIADGNRELIGELYQRNYGVLYKLAYRYYTLYSDRCISAGVTLEDMMSECYFAVYTAAKSYAKGKREYKFTSYLKYATLQYFQQMAGTRTEKQRNEPLNSCKSLDVPIEGTEDLTLADTIEDIDAAEKADDLIDSLAYGEVFPEVKRVLADEPEQYDTIYAIYHDNISPSEWARMKGVPLQAIRSQREKAFRELRKEDRSAYLRSLYEDIISSSYRKGGLKAFRNSWTSSVEWAVLQRDNITE